MASSSQLPDQIIGDTPTSFAPILTTVTNAPTEPNRQSRIDGRIQREKAALEEKLRQQCRTTRKLRTQLALLMEVFRAMSTFCENTTGSKSDSPSMETSLSGGSSRTAPTENEEAVVPAMIAAILRNKVTLAVPVKKAVESLVALKLSEQDALNHARQSRNAHKQNLARMSSLSERSATYSQSMANHRIWSGPSYDTLASIGNTDYGNLGRCVGEPYAHTRRRVCSALHPHNQQYHASSCYPRTNGNRIQDYDLGGGSAAGSSARKLPISCTPRQGTNVSREAYDQRTSSSGPNTDEVMLSGKHHRNIHYRSATMAGKLDDCATLSTPDKTNKVLGSIGGMVRTLFTGTKHHSGKKHVKRRPICSPPPSSSRDDYHYVPDCCWENSGKKETDDGLNINDHSHQSSFYGHYRQKSCSGALASPPDPLEQQQAQGWRN